MSSMRLAFSSDGARRLSSLAEGERAVVVDVRASSGGRADRLLALGVTLRIHSVDQCVLGQ